ncbi:MAG: HicB family protein [Segetibacter sp.]|nr:HicB family protein [Segetibacter sp.]
MNEILQYNGYCAIVAFSNADDVFFGKIIGINDLVTFEGESVAELKQAFKEAVDDYLETCAELGKTPDKAYKGVFNVRIPSELHKKASLVAATKDITLNELVKTALDKLLNENKNNRELAH